MTHYIMGVIYSDLGEADKAIEEYKRSLKDQETLTTYLNLASVYIKKDDIDSAIKELNSAAKFAPDAVEPHAILAILYAARKTFDLATDEYRIALEKASKLHPNDIEIAKNLGIVYMQQKKYGEASRVFRLLVDLSPKDAEAHFYLANAYYETNELTLTEKELKAAIEINPDYHEALNFLGYMYVEENRNLDAAEKMIGAAIKMNPDNGAYIDSLGWLYYKKGKVKEAAIELEKAVSLLEDPVIYDHLGDVYFELKDYKAARLSWQKALELNPQRKEVLKKLENVKNNGS